MKLILGAKYLLQKKISKKWMKNLQMLEMQLLAL